MSILNLKNKNVLMFCPSFFGYDTEIKKEIETLGATVSLFDERVFSNVFGKALIRLNFRRGIKYHIEKFYTKKLLNQVKDIDYILLINPETITTNILRRAKEINPNVKIITYMWDSFKNKTFSTEYIKLSDSFFTFDPVDAEEKKVNFLPLFFVNDYQNIKEKEELKYRLSFIGTAHSERFNIVKNLTRSSTSNFLFFYCPSKIVYLYKKYIKNELNGLKISDISFSSMSRQSIIDVIECSHSIIDVCHPSQVGLTMRSIEMLGAKKKLITTNIEILSYDFYHSNNILYVNDETTSEQINRFIELPYYAVCDDIYHKYGISNWIKRLFHE